MGISRQVPGAERDPVAPPIFLLADTDPGALQTAFGGSALNKKAARSGCVNPVVARAYPINLRRSTPARPSMPEPNSMRLLGSGVESLVPIKVKDSEGIVPRVLS